MSHRFYVISEVRGLIAVTDTQDRANELALIATVNTGRTVHLHDRLTESTI